MYDMYVHNLRQQISVLNMCIHIPRSSLAPQKEAEIQRQMFPGAHKLSDKVFSLMSVPVRFPLPVFLASFPASFPDCGEYLHFLDQRNPFLVAVGELPTPSVSLLLCHTFLQIQSCTSSQYVFFLTGCRLRRPSVVCRPLNAFSQQNYREILYFQNFQI